MPLATFCAAFRNAGATSLMRNLGGKRFLTAVTPLSLVLAFFLVSPCGQAQQPTQPVTQPLTGHVSPAITQGKAPLLGAMAASEPMRLAIQLPLTNQAELSALLQRLYDPSSSDYHHYLSTGEFTERFGPSTEDYQAVVDFAKSNGFTVGQPAGNRLLINITGTAAQVEAAFHVKMGIYQHPTESRSFFSPDREPSLNLQVPVAHIIGLNSYSGVKNGAKYREGGQSGNGTTGNAASNTGSGPNGSFLVGDLRAAYYGGTALTGSGQCVGMYELGGYDPSDVTNSFGGVPYNVPLNNVLIDGASAGVTPGGDDIEQVMDIVAAIGMAPGLSQVRVYIGPANAWGDVNVINSMATENQCKQLSSSYSWSNPDYAQDNGVFEEFAAQGQTFLNCSLDDGSYGTTFPFTYPQDDIWVTGVGGTAVITSGPSGQWVSETAWTNSGGGMTINQIGIPDWQLPAINAGNGGSTTLRNVPDIAAEGNTDNYLCYTTSGGQSCADGWGGTSIATPRWAGFLALVNQQLVSQGKPPVGYLNPTLYAIGLSPGYNSIFHDITSGNNDCCSQTLYYNAVPGYDLATGWGSPNGQNMIDALVQGNYTTPAFMIENSQDELPLAAGSTYATTLGVYSSHGFSGTVALGVTGLPNGVTATLSPTSVTLTANGTATSTVTWTISSSASLGTAYAALTATSGGTTETEPVAITVGAPTRLQVSVSTLQFGSVPVGSGSYGPVVFLDNMGQTIALFDANSAATSNSAFAVVQNSCIPVLLPGKSCQLYLSFVPPAEGTTTGTLTITDNASGSPQTVSLTGTGGTGTVSLTTPGLQFGEFPAGNWGNFYQLDVLNYTANTLSFPTPIGTSGPFLENDDCLPSLAAWGACWITMEFQPVTLGPATGTVSVFNSATSSPLTATLSGFGGTQTVMLYPSPNVINIYPPVGGVKFGYQTENAPSVPQLVTLFNGTSSTLSIAQISAGGGFAENDNCGSTLAVYASCIIQVTFTPSATGAVTGTLTVTDSDATSPQTLALSGAGIAASDGSVVLSPASWDFGSVATNNWSSWGGINLTNNGSNPLTIGSVSVNGPVTLDTNCTGTVAPGASCSIGIIARTAVLGKVNGEITITDSDGNHFVPLSITGVPQTVSLSPASLTFGDQPLGTTSAAQSVTLLNNLPNTLVITGVKVTGPFTQTNNCGSSVASWGGTCTVNVTFTPTAFGSATGTLTVTDTGANSPQTITLTGTGGTASAALSPASLSFGSLAVGSTSAVKPVTLSNGGTAALAISGIAASGAFGQANNCGNSLAAGGSCTINVTFTPTATGAAIGALSVTDNATGSPQSVSLSGTGIPAPSFSLSATGATVTAGSTGSSMVTETAVNGYNTKVTLSAGGLPTGVTAAFKVSSPLTSTLTFTAGLSATAGAYTVTVTGTPAAGQAKTISLALTVNPAPSFSLSATNAIVTLGSTGTSKVTETVNGIFSTRVTFATGALPAGVTAAFNLASLGGAGSTTLTFTASSSAAAGAYTITVTGTPAIGTAKTATFTLTVSTVPAFALSATNATLTAGSSGASTVSETVSGGYSSKVNLAVSGLPTGVTAAFRAASPLISTLTFTAGSAAAAGTCTITVTGTPVSGTAKTATLTLTVNAAPAFALTASDATITAGATSASTITETVSGGYATRIAFSVSGLPTGVTAAFSPAALSGAGSSTLTFTAGSAAAGAYTVTVTGTPSSGMARTATLTLTVSPAAVDTINASGTLASGSFTYTPSFTCKAGTLNATLTVSPGSQWRFVLINGATNTIATESDGAGPLTINTSVTAGPYSLYVQVNSGSGGAWSISGSHP
jgi:hypothetical protein